MYSNILHPLRLEELAKNWLFEDTSHFDFASGAIDGESEFVIYMKNDGVLAGIPFADAVFKVLGLNSKWNYKDGDVINAISKVGNIWGKSNKLLLAERVVLNVLSRASGVASVTADFYSLLNNVGWKGILAGTRKTTPGFRMVEKYALLMGGADMHRYDLSSMVMLKDNHVTMAGSIQKAIDNVRKLSGFSVKIEVECRCIEEARDAGKSKCDIIMLDNFEPEKLTATASTLKHQFPEILIEASGGITKENIQDFATPYIDIISSSCLVQGYPTIDFSMKFASAL